MKMLLICVAAISFLSSVACADNVELDISCKRFGSSGINSEFSEVACFIGNDQKIYEGSVASDKMEITALELYDQPVNTDNMKKGKIVGLKLVSRIIGIKGQTMFDLEEDSGKFCRINKIAKDKCKISTMFFYVRTTKDNLKKLVDKEARYNEFNYGTKKVNKPASSGTKK